MRIILIAGAYLLLVGGNYAIAQSAGNILDSKKQAPVGFGVSSEQRSKLKTCLRNTAPNIEIVALMGAKF